MWVGDWPLLQLDGCFLSTRSGRIPKKNPLFWNELWLTQHTWRTLAPWKEAERPFWVLGSKTAVWVCALGRKGAGFIQGAWDVWSFITRWFVVRCQALPVRMEPSESLSSVCLWLHWVFELRQCRLLGIPIPGGAVDGGPGQAELGAAAHGRGGGWGARRPHPTQPFCDAVSDLSWPWEAQREAKLSLVLKHPCKEKEKTKGFC